ncbi:MAG: tryptophan synthase subunit alpha [Candidatus Omnitrophica bacterium]|nr:tryptophan synthase subunit alpha [Candidatus Omnitrophota bacterium]
MENRIDLKFKELKNKKKKAFIAFVTAGDPDLKTTEQLVLAFEGAGVDIVELGVPFSDPLADGPTIQAASQRALKKHVNLGNILAAVKRIRQRSGIPIALMTYYNPVFHYGEERFAAQAKAAGVDGLIVPDLPPEEGHTLIRAARKNGIATVFFLAPTTDPKRIPAIVKASTGFIYFVSLRGVTGSGKMIFTKEIKHQIGLARKNTQKPICIGFGVSTPKEVKEMANISDGVIVGSAIVTEIFKHKQRKKMVADVSRFVRELSHSLP